MSAVDLSDEVTLSYAERGEIGDRAVVLLPGPTDSWRSYTPILGPLPQRLRVVAASLRGHGDSSKPATGYRIENLASDVVALLDALDIRHAVLVGHSGSCLVARKVALDAPDRVAGLVLEASPTTLHDDARLRSFVDDTLSDLAEPIDREFARSFIADTSTDRLDGSLVDLLVDDLVKVPVRTWREMFASLLAYDDTAELPTITVPALLVWGDADPILTRDMQHELVRLMPRATLAEYEGVGHTPRWERPERFAADLSTFAAEVLA